MVSIVPTSSGALEATVPGTRHLERPGMSLRKGRFESKSNHSAGRRERLWGLEGLSFLLCYFFAPLHVL